MSIYKARWRNALKQAAKINRLLRKGYIVFDKNNSKCDEFFELTKNGTVLCQITKTEGHKFTWMWFENNKDFDHGLYTTIKEFNKRFEGMTAVHPRHVIKL